MLNTSKIKTDCFLVKFDEVNTNNRLDYLKACETIPGFALSKENTEYNTSKIILSKDDFILWSKENPEKIFILTNHFRDGQQPPSYFSKAYFVTFKEYICGHHVDYKHKRIRSGLLSSFIWEDVIYYPVQITHENKKYEKEAFVLYESWKKKSS